MQNQQQQPQKQSSQEPLHHQEEAQQANLQPQTKRSSKGATELASKGLQGLLMQNRDLAIHSTKENKKIEFPMSQIINAMTCENKKKGNEHFRFDQGTAKFNPAPGKSAQLNCGDI